jgi:hypothetical protein
VTAVAEATGVARSTIGRGLSELRGDETSVGFQCGWLARTVAGLQPHNSVQIILMHPIAKRLTFHARPFGCLSAALPVQNKRQSQKATHRPTVPTFRRSSAKVGSRDRLAHPILPAINSGGRIESQGDS